MKPTSHTYMTRPSRPATGVIRSLIRCALETPHFSKRAHELLLKLSRDREKKLERKVIVGGGGNSGSECRIVAVKWFVARFAQWMGVHVRGAPGERTDFVTLGLWNKRGFCTGKCQHDIHCLLFFSVLCSHDSLLIPSLKRAKHRYRS